MSEELKIPEETQHTAGMDMSAATGSAPAEDRSGSAPVKKKKKRPAADGSAPVKKKRPASEDGSAPVRKKRPVSEDGSSPVRKKRPVSEDGSSPVRKKRPVSADGSAPVKKKRPASEDGAAPVRKKRPLSADGSTPVKKVGDSSVAVPGKRPAVQRRNPANAGASAAPRPAVSRTPRRRPAQAAQPAKGSTSARASQSRSKDRAATIDRLRTVGRYALRFEGSIVLTVICIAVIIWSFTSSARSDSAYTHFKEMEAAVNHEYFFDGISVENKDVSGMTLEQAEEYFAENVEPAYQKTTVSLDNGTSYTAKELGYSSDYIEVLEKAFGAGRSGTLEERYENLTAQEGKSTGYTVSRAMYSDTKLKQYVDEVAKLYAKPAVSATVDSFNTTDCTFTFTEDSTGQELDTAKLTSDIKSALDAGGGEVQLKIDTVYPEHTSADVASSFGMITSSTTNASKSTDARLANIKLACQTINGWRISPGQIFSFNDAIGERTLERGFQVATAYSGGAISQEVGGGICQVSTTLFNAVVKANLKVVERHNHSLTISYVDLGKDAAVNWRSRDFRFANTNNDTVYLRAYVTKDKKVVIEIYGELLPNGEYITVEAVTTGTIPFEQKLVINEEMAPGRTEITQEGKEGYKATAYKVRWSADGKELKRTKLCDSYYSPITEITEMGPESPSPG